MYIVGIDIAKRSHEAIIIDSSGGIIKNAFNFKNDRTGFDKLIRVLDSLGNRSEILIGMESTSHYWLALFSNLQNKGYTVHVLNPIQSNALRGMYIRQLKNDEHDCLIIADVIRFGRYTQGELPQFKLYELRELCRARLFVVDMVSDLKRKVIALMDRVFPEYETVFSNMFGSTSMNLLSTYSTPEEILSADIEELTDIVSIPSRKRFGLPKAQEIKNTAMDSFGIVFAEKSMSTLIKQHIKHIRFIENQICEIDDAISDLFSEFDTCITTIPGIGNILGATIFSEIGNISRFDSAVKLAAFAGIDPTVKQSGEFTGTHNHMSKRGSPYLRRALWQASTVAVRNDPVLHEFFRKKRAQGKPYMNAIGHVTRKMVNIIYAVMRDNKPYYCPEIS